MLGNGDEWQCMSSSARTHSELREGQLTMSRRTTISIRPRGSPSTAISMKHTEFAIVTHSGRSPEDADVLLVYLGAALTQLGNCLSWCAIFPDCCAAL